MRRRREQEQVEQEPVEQQPERLSWAAVAERRGYWAGSTCRDTLDMIRQRRERFGE